jgi:hypothetical protein
MRTDYSVEYCHIYSNESIGPEQAESLDYLVEVRKQLEAEGKTYSLCVMLDNYTFPDRIFDKTSFLEWLRSRGETPDVFINEGDLIPAADEVITLVSPKKARSLRRYIEEKKYPCSLFIAAWYLSRMGKLKNHPSAINQFSDKLINILHERLEPYEEEGREIILDTPFAEVVNNITNRYFGGYAHPPIEEHTPALVRNW